MYRKDGTVVGEPVTINDLAVGEYIGSYDVSTDGNGDFITAWCRYRQGANSLLLQKINKDGILVGSNVVAGHEFRSTPVGIEILDGDTNEIFLKWKESGKYKAQYFSDDLSLKGESFDIINLSENAKSAYDFKYKNGNFIFAWESNKTPGTGLDIYMNISSGLELTTQQDEEHFNLFQNYPNPFNSYTSIGYSLPKPSFVTIKIYDALGREVKTVLNKSETEGLHQLSFDAGNLASGIYIYQLIADDITVSRKMLLMK